MRRSSLAWFALALCFADAMPAHADQGDKAGWSVLTDPRHRAFLIWTPEQDGPRVLMLACLRDAEMFTAMSYAVGERAEIKSATLILSNGSARFEVAGSITNYPAIGRSSFISDLDVDAKQLQALGRKLLPVLEAPGDITLTFASGAGAAAAPATPLTIPRAGLPAVLGRFHNVCFR